MCKVVFSLILVLLTSCSANYLTPKCEARLFAYNQVIFACNSIFTGVYDNQTDDCTFQVRNNEILTNDTGDVKITYKASGNTTFPSFVVTCWLSLLYRDLIPGSYQIQVTVSTNDSALNMTSDWTPPVNLTAPSVALRDCVTNVSVSYKKNYVTCYCAVYNDNMPAGTRRWLKDGQTATSIGSIVIYYEETLENHTFMCVPVSRLKTGPLPGVIYAPKWPLSPMILGFMLNGTSGRYVMPVNSTANFTCLAINTDISNIVYVKRDTGEVINSKVMSFLKVMPSCRDMGMYECHILGSQGQVIMRDSLEVTLECLSLRDESIQARNISAKVGDVVEIDVPIIGYPVPRLYSLYMQLRNGTSYMAQDKYHVFYDSASTDPTFEKGTVKLSIHSIEATSFTNFTLAINNEMVILNYIFSINEKSVPRNDTLAIIVSTSVVGSLCLIFIAIMVGLLIKKKGCFKKR